MTATCRLYCVADKLNHRDCQTKCLPELFTRFRSNSYAHQLF